MFATHRTTLPSSDMIYKDEMTDVFLPHVELSFPIVV